MLATLVVAEHGIQAAAPHMGWWRFLFPISGLLGHLWAFGESLSMFLRMQRRRRLGLASPELCHRFLFFALLAVTWVAANACLVPVMAMDASPIETPWFIATVSAMGIANAAMLIFAFAAPRWYRVRIAGGERSVGA